MSFDDELRASREHLQAGMRHRKFFDPDKLTAEVPEPYTAPPDAQLSHDDLLAAWRELAEQHGVSSARVRGMVMLTAAKAGLGYSLEEQAAVTGELALAMDAGKTNVSDEQILALSGRADDTIGLAAAEDQREAVRGEAMTLGLTVTAAERDRLVKTGQALPDGDFPAHNSAHLAAAKSEYKKRNLGGHSAAEVRAHINRNAKRLGLPGLDDDDHNEYDVAATMALAGLTQETRAMALAAGSGGMDSAAAVIARHPELSYLFRAGKTSRRKHPRRSDQLVTTDSRAHSSDTGDEDTMDRDQPARGGKVHAAVRRLIEENPHLFTDGEGRDPSAMTAWPAG